MSQACVSPVCVEVSRGSYQKLTGGLSRTYNIPAVRLTIVSHSVTVSRMRVWVNGDALELEAGATVLRLLERAGIDPVRVAVERNRDIVPRQSYANECLAEGDRLEIVTFVGGG